MTLAACGLGGRLRTPEARASAAHRDCDSGAGAELPDIPEDDLIDMLSARAPDRLSDRDLFKPGDQRTALSHRLLNSRHRE